MWGPICHPLPPYPLPPYLCFPLFCLLLLPGPRSAGGRRRRRVNASFPAVCECPPPPPPPAARAPPSFISTLLRRGRSAAEASTRPPRYRQPAAQAATRSPPSSLLGNSQNSWNKFSGRLNPWRSGMNLEPAKLRSREPMKIWNLESAKLRSREPVKIWNLELAKLRSRKPVKLWNLEPAKPLNSRICEDTEPWTCETMKSGIYEIRESTDVRIQRSWHMKISWIKRFTN
jgi:hypothetical protein